MSVSALLLDIFINFHNLFIMWKIKFIGLFPSVDKYVLFENMVNWIDIYKLAKIWKDYKE
jgi:hypothetical protein